MGRRVGICTGGGDAPGLNAVIRAFVKHAVRTHGWEVVGIEDSFDGLLETPRRLQELSLQSCQGLLHRGGTILGTTNRGDPFAYLDADGVAHDRSAELAAAARAAGLEGIVTIGGDGTLREVLEGLASVDRSDLPVAMLPMGTANVLAVDFRLPDHVPGVLELVRAGRTRDDRECRYDPIVCPIDKITQDWPDVFWQFLATTIKISSATIQATQASI